MSLPCATCGRPLPVTITVVCSEECRAEDRQLCEKIIRMTRNEQLREEVRAVIARTAALQVYPTAHIEAAPQQHLDDAALACWGQAHNVINSALPHRALSRCPVCTAYSNLRAGSRCVMLRQYVPPVRCTGILQPNGERHADNP